MNKKCDISQPTCFVWLDLEMTGLDPSTDVILELAVVITDLQLNVIAEGPSLVIHHTRQVLDRMDTVVHEMHTASGLLERVATSNISVAMAHEEICNFLVRHIAKDTRALLAGNSIWNDRAFLQRYMPNILKLLHYRIIDVSTLKELIMQWCPDASVFKKKKGHRALADIYESIAELQYYKEQYFKCMVK